MFEELVEGFGHVGVSMTRSKVGQCEVLFDEPLNIMVGLNEQGFLDNSFDGVI